MKILLEHSLNRVKQSVASSTSWQDLNAVQQLGFADSGQVQVLSRLPSHPIDNVGTGIGAHQL